MRYFILLGALCFVGCASGQKQATSSSDSKNAVLNQESKMAVTAAAEKPVAATPSVVQKPSPLASSQKVSCKKGTDMRVLEVVKKENGCALNYTKFEKTSTVASSALGAKYCEGSEERIRAKLEKSGFQCN